MAKINANNDQAPLPELAGTAVTLAGAVPSLLFMLSVPIAYLRGLKIALQLAVLPYVAVLAQ